MLSFMDYVVNSFGDATNWNRDNAYSSLTATSDAILDFPTPQNLRLNVSSLASPQFATSYSLGTFGLLDGSISYLYTTLPMRIPSQTPSIPLRTLIEGYRQLSLPLPPSSHARWQTPRERKDTLLSATLHLPSPSRLNGLYVRRVSPETLVTISLNSLRSDSLQPHSPPPSALLAHITHDTGKYSVEGLASSDNALLGFRGLWNFGRDLSPNSANSEPAKVDTQDVREAAAEGQTESSLSPVPLRTARPSLLSAGGEFYYSPLSSVIGLSTGLRFTTLTTSQSSSRSVKPLSGTSAALSSQLASQVPTAGTSSFPYTLTLTLTPLTGSLNSTYSVRASPTLSLSSRFGFNVYSWESEYVVGAEVWRKQHKSIEPEKDNLSWARDKMATWYEDAKVTVSSSSSEPSPPLPPERLLETTTPIVAKEPPLQIEESVLKLRLDDGFNFRALWTGRIKSLLVSAGLSVGPQGTYSGLRRKNEGEGGGNGFVNGGSGSGPWRSGIGVEVVYSS